MAILLEGLIITFFEAIIQKMFFETFRGKSKVLGKRLEKVYVVFIWLSLLLVAFINIDVVIAKPLIAILLITIMMYIYYREHPIQLFIFAAIYYAMMIAIDYLSILMVKYLFQDDFQEIWNNQVNSVFVALASRTISFMIVVIIRKKWNRDDSFNLISDAEWIRFIYFPVLTIVAILILLSEKNMSNRIVIIGFGLVIMNMFVFYMIRDIVYRERNIQNMRLSEERNRNLLTLYENMDETYKNQRRNVHDFKNQLGCIRGLLQSGNSTEAMEYTNNLSKTWNDNVIYVDTNNAIANAVLNQKYKYATENNVILVMSLSDLGDIFIDKQDIVTIMANLLDNAIEACMELKENRIVHFKFIYKDDEICISVKNPVNKPLEIKDNIIQTSKANKNEHGIGMRNIESSIKKYKGESIVAYEEGYFYYNAEIPKNT